MRPLTTTSAGTLTQLGSLDTHLAGNHVLQGALPPKDNSGFSGPPPLCVYIYIRLCLYPIPSISLNDTLELYSSLKAFTYRI